MSATTQPTTTPQRWHAVRRLLVVRLDNLGDVLMTTPALAALRESLPGAHIALLASPAGAALAPHLPMIDDCIAFDAPWVKSCADDDAPGATEAALVERLHCGRYDAAVVFTVCTQSALPAALLCRLAGIPLRLAHSRENPYRLLTDWVRDPDLPLASARHEVQRQLDLVAAVGLRAEGDDRLRLAYRADDAHTMRARFAAAGGDPRRPYFVVHPGATAPSRRWPCERYGEAARALVDASGCQAVFCGAEDDRAHVDAARAALGGPCVDLTGRLALGELAALVAGAQVVLCNNSAASHIASALGRPVVVLYALTNPQHVPWRVRARVLSRDVPCRNCLRSVCPEPNHGCLGGVTVREVVEAATSLLGPPPGVPYAAAPLPLEVHE